MLQRIQSVYLFLCAAALSIALFTKVWSAASNESLMIDAFTSNVSVAGTLTTKNIWYVGLTIVVSILLSFYTISQFKNRILQVKLINFNNLLLCAVVGLYYWEISQAKKVLTGEYADNWGVAFIVPLIGLVLNILAIRSIKKDEALVKSVDRLR